MPAAGAAERSARHWGLGLAVGGALAFAGKGIIVKLAYRHGVDAVTLIAMRMLLAAPLFALMAWWSSRGQAPLPRRDWVAVLGLGFTGYYLSSFLDFLGLQFVSAALERLILYLNPTLVLLLGWLLFGRRVGRGQVAALGLSYLGILVVFGHEAHLGGRRVALGSALVLASALAYAVYLLYSGEVVRRIGAQRLTGCASLVACTLCVLQFALLRPVEMLADVPQAVWWLSLINATACTVAPMLMVMMAIERLGPAVASQAGMLGPVATALMGTVFLDEALTVWVVCGSLLVLAGVWMLARVRPA